MVKRLASNQESRVQFSLAALILKTMTFKKYPKIHRLGKEETDGMLSGLCHIQEKIDGANTSIWLDKRGELTCGSRTRELTEGFNGFVDYVKGHEGIKKLLEDNPNYRLYGEWLVRHTIGYNETSYKKFYLFDITVVKDGEENEEFFDIVQVNEIAEEYGIEKPQYFGLFENPTLEELMKFVGASCLGEKGEGIVIKNMDHKDKWGNHCYAKIVTEKFKEDNALTFGGNNKHSESYWEMYIVNKYITLGRVEKVMNKIQPEVDERLDKEHTPRVINTVYHDMIIEEIWEIQKKVQHVNFGVLRKLATRKAAKVFHDILNNHISVAYENNNNAEGSASEREDDLGEKES